MCNDRDEVNLNDNGEIVLRRCLRVKKKTNCFFSAMQKRRRERTRASIAASRYARVTSYDVYSRKRNRNRNRDPLP